MKVSMMLCDHAQVADNKLFINGAGWDVCGTPTPPHAVAILVAVPWDQTNIRFEYQLQLVSEDGRRVGEAGGAFEVGRPSGLRPGTPITVPLVMAVTPMQLDADTGYEWRLVIGGRTEEDWSLPFRTARPGERRAG